MDPREQKLLSLLSNNDVTFFIPPYQRNYEWTEMQCSVFLEDVKKTCNNNVQGITDEHFFGSITYFQDDTAFGDPDKLVLIDGQQRITTTMLFLIAARDILSDDKAVQDFIDSRYLKNNNAPGENDEYKVKLKQVETDWQTYKDLVLGNASSISGNALTSAVYQNYKYFCNELKKYKGSGGDIKQLIDKGVNKFSVVTIELKPRTNKWENPQEIFESMNSLGKPLSLADLVRNYLLLGLNSDEQTNLYNKYWLHIEKVVPRNISDFIRDFMQCLQKCSYPKSTEANYKTLYSMFKEVFTGINPESMLKELSEYSDLYAYIIGGTPSGSSRLDRILADLRIIRITTAHSFILSLIREWKRGKMTENDIVECMDAFRIYCFRRRLIGMTTAENKQFPTLTRKLPEIEAAADKKAKMFEILSKQETNLRLPNDIELTRELENMNFYSFQYKKVFLSLIEEKLTKSRPDLTDEVLQVEHIMPHTLNDQWKKDLGENAEAIHQTYADNIGNLTLIRHNQELGQKVFSEKKKIYDENAGLQIARTKITSHDKWDEAAIKERMHWIIGYLLNDVLPIPDKMRKTNNFSTDGKKKLSFIELQLIGEYITFHGDPNIRAKVVSDKEVEYEGAKIRLSPLTAKIRRMKGTATPSESYQGAAFWDYEGMLLIDLI